MSKTLSIFESGVIPPNTFPRIISVLEIVQKIHSGTRIIKNGQSQKWSVVFED